jgi:hypothetical protein
MKTHEIANQLELLAKLLRSLPNAEIEDTITEPMSLFAEQKQATKQPNKTIQSLPTGIEKKLENMSPVEIEKLLSSETEAFTSSQLQEIASKFGISTSKRQSKNALINLIARHFEAIKMDSIIRSSKKEES